MFAFTEHPIATLHNERVAGCALDGVTLTTWGHRVLRWTLPQSRPTVLRGAGPPLDGGCLLDVNGDGRPDLVLNEGGENRALVWLEAPHWKRRVIDTGVDAPDMIPATLFGRRGVLLIHKRQQVRFYEAAPDGRWPYEDLYSVYTPSWQGGLALADIDGDGRTDILCGNYWIRSPEAPALPWRLFAIDLWTETERSALQRLVYREPVLYAVQRAVTPARLAWFERPADPRALWTEHRLEGRLELAEPNSLDVADFDGDGRPDLLVAEAAGRGRVIVFRNEGHGQFTPHVIAEGRPVEHAKAAGRDILLIRKPGTAISWLRNRSALPR